MKTLAPGFTEPVFDSQKFFRLTLTAMSVPAQPVSLPVLSLVPDAASPFSAGMAALALTLCDNNTPIWLQPEADTETVRHYLRFHCGAVFAETPEHASFAFITHPQTMPGLSAFAQGTALYPEQSTTLVVAASFASGPAFLAQGPGIGGQQGDTRSFLCEGMPETFWREWVENRHAFPLGVDVLFLDESATGNGAGLMGLPRTTAVRPIDKDDKENLACMSL